MNLRKAPPVDARSEAIIRAAFARFDLIALALAAGVTVGAILFVATVSLLLRGAPPGEHIGSHLGLLSHFLPGYSVSWSGGLVGTLYGFLIGAGIGGAVAFVWNIVHYIYLALLLASATSTSPDL